MSHDIYKDMRISHDECKMTFIVEKTPSGYVATFGGCEGKGDTWIQAVERAKRAYDVQQAFERPIEEIEKDLPF